MTPGRSKVAAFVLDNSLLLLLGTAAAVVWANVDIASYEHVAHPLHFAVNDIGMVFFFALAAKEVFEATLPGGALASPRRALSPLAAAVGGMAVPALIYVGLASTIGPAELVRGWAIPCATDIAFSAMVARIIFPGAHPAIPFLLLLAIADDAIGLIILAVFYPSGRLTLSAPIALMYPLFLVIFGVGNATKIYVASFGAALVILFNVAYGVMNARKTRILAAILRAKLASVLVCDERTAMTALRMATAPD